MTKKRIEVKTKSGLRVIRIDSASIKVYNQIATLVNAWSAELVVIRSK